MKSWIKILCGVSVLAVFAAPSVFAQQQTSQTTPASALVPAPTEEQIQAMYESYYKNAGSLAAGDKDASLTVGSIGNPFQKEEVKKDYRYDGKKHLLYGVKMPERSFNNIDYPY